MKRVSSILLILTLFFAWGSGALAAEENLLKNPGFETLDADGLPEGWKRDMWFWEEGISELFAVSGPEAYAGKGAICVDNLGANDASFEQTAQVEPGTLYKVSCMVKVEGCADDEAGAGISIKNTFASSESLYETMGAWTRVTLYGVTGEDQTELTVMARVGSYGSLNVGRAWFDEFSLTKAEEAEEGAAVYAFSTLPPADYEEEDDWEDEGYEALTDGSEHTPVLLIVALLFALVAAALLIASGRGRIFTLTETPDAGRIMGVILLTALIVRLILAALVHGYDVDINCFVAWALRMGQTGPSGFYSPDVFCDYPPGYMYILWPVGLLLGALGASYDSGLSVLVIKIVPILCDVTLAYMAYRAARETLGRTTACLLGALLAFNPVFLVNSAAWGQIDSVFTALLLVSMLEAVRGRWFVSLPVYALSALIKPQALMLAPLGLVFVIVEIVESEDHLRALGRFLLAILASLALMVALSLPFMLGLPESLLPETASATAFGYRLTLTLPEGLRPLFWLGSQYLNTASSYAHLTVNACNLYTLLNMNWVATAQAPATTVFAWIMMALSFAYAVFLYVRAKDRGKLFLVSALLVTLLYAFAPMMHERYLFPALAFLALAYAFDRDARVIGAFVALSTTLFLNTGLVLASEHLLSSQQFLNAAISLVNVLTAMFLAWTAWEMCVSGRTIALTRVYKPSASGKENGKRESEAVREALLRPRDARLGLRRKDFTFMIALTVLYACVAFVNLGSTKAPQTSWRSTAAGEQITFDLGQTTDFHMTYYGPISTSTFMAQFSEDGEVWTQAHYAQYGTDEMFRWLWYKPSEMDRSGTFYALESGYSMQHARFVRLTAEKAGLTLSEVAFLDAQGSPLPIASVHSAGGSAGRRNDPAALIDEQDSAPAYPSYLTGMYFDEVYHGRTAYEHLNGIHAYEYTHPPLGKVLIMIGLQIFGMTPFGWRFMPALFGVLAVPLMYLLTKQLFKRSSLSLIGGLLMAVDLMHFTQSRLATVDIFAVFFIMASYLFMIRYAQMSFYHQKLARTFVPLFFSGLFMGLGIAVKWIGVYSALGLAAIFFFTLAQRLRESLFARRNLRTLDPDARRVATRAARQFWENAAATLLVCVVFFIAVPCAIYYFSYYWHMRPDGGLNLEAVWNLQKTMFDYHSGISATAHYFASPWYEWPLIVKPIWFYSGAEFMPEGMVSSISCMGNPVVWWGGLISLIVVILRLCISCRSDRRYLYIVVGFCAQFLPWIFITRATFIYHYFASVPFIILATVAVFEWLRRRSVKAYHILGTTYCVLATLLFGAFYPLASGAPIRRDLAMYLRWFNWYNF